MLTAHKSGLILVSGLVLAAAVALTPFAAVHAATIRHSQQQQPAASPTITTTRPVNIRSGPGTNYRILATAQAGETYTVTGKMRRRDLVAHRLRRGDGLGLSRASCRRRA